MNFIENESKSPGEIGHHHGRNAMSVHSSARIHSTAVISAEATISENVEIGPFVVVDGAVQIG